MITNSGALCDVCGKYILPFDPDETVNFFSVAQIPNTELCCHNVCRTAVETCGGDWEKLPPGPLRKAYEEADKKRKAGHE